MSKLIIDMEMPKSCADCPLLDERWDYPMCIVTQETRGYNFDTLNKKMDKCPIVGVLPDEHGDLIDRDELKENKIYSHERHEYVVPVAYIDWQDAVIAAKRKD